jgi:hypothetical protein
MEVLRLTPPFTYSYQCGSTLLISYIPVYMYSILIQITIDLLRVTATLVFPTTISEVDSPPPPPLCLSSQFINVNFCIHRLRHENISIANITAILINNMSLLLSFGLLSPVLCCGAYFMLANSHREINISILSSSR